MAAPKLISLLALASFLVVALSFAPRHVNALVADRAQVARHVHARDAVAKRKRSNSSSCQPRPTSTLDSALPTSTSTPPPPTSTTPTASSTSSAAPSPTSASSNTSGKKWGLAWGADPQDLANFNRPNVGFCYNWSPSPPDCSQYGMPMPMFWGPTFADAFQSAVVNGPDVSGVYALGFNEPNEPSQSNMSPQDAVNLWMTYMIPLVSKGYSLVSPACTDDDAGLTWYSEFMGNCSATPGCKVDSMAFHSYNTDSQHLIDYATTLHNTYNLPVMITEFADQDYSGANNQATMNQVWDYAGVVKNFIDSTDWFILAAPFGIMNPLPNNVNPDNSLLDASTGGPTALGYFYFG